MKRTKDYDNVFQTLKHRHKRLFISVINDIFSLNYPDNSDIEILPSKGYLTKEKTTTGEMNIEEKETDSIIRIDNDIFILECQSYDDDTMAIRIVEYAFITARQFATYKDGKVIIPMPNFAVIYIKSTDRTPRQTDILFTFPNGTEVTYSSNNVFLTDLTREYIIEKKLFPYIPFYIARYEKELATDTYTHYNEIELNTGISRAIDDLEYFRDEMIRSFENGELRSEELLDLTGYVNTIITHITDGNKAEKGLVSIMGGTIIESESERLIRIGEERGETKGIAIGEERGEAKGIAIGEERGEAKGIAIGEERGIRSLIETCQEFGLSMTDAAEKLISKFGLSEKASMTKANQYWKH